jgi:hypothetical protein
MTASERVDAVARLGFTPRQAAFLVTVATHSGVCLARHYGTFAGLVWGQAIRDFFGQLVQRGLATAWPCARRGTQLYHLQNKAIYRVIGEPDSRLRRPAAVARAVERLMVLDAILAAPDLVWLGTERDKVGHFRACSSISEGEMPRVVFRSANGDTIRNFPDRLPIGCHPDGRPPVFLYLVRDWDSFDFRMFLQRHGPLFRALAEWRIRLVVPPHLAGAEEGYQVTCWNELATPLKSDTLDELRWYFEHRRDRGEPPTGSVDEDRYKRANGKFSAPRFRALYRQWKDLGDGLLEFQGSHLLSEALKRGTGRVESHVLQRQYSHLSPLVGTV